MKLIGMLLAVVLVAGAGKPSNETRNAAGSARLSEVAMADSIWISTTGDLNSAVSYSPNGIPVATGRVTFDGSSDFDVLSGLSAFTGLDMTEFWTTPDYDGNIGADGNFLATGIRRFSVQGSGSVYYSPEPHASAAYVIVDSLNQQDALVVSGSATGAVDLIMCINGGVSILNGCQSLSSLFVGSRDSMSFPIVSIGSGVVDTVDVKISSGVVTTKSTLSTGSARTLVDGGLLVVDATVTDAWQRIEIAGGTVQYNSTGQLQTCIIMSGTLDMSQDGRAKTIALLIIMPGGNFITHSRITVTSLTDLRGQVPILP